TLPFQFNDHPFDGAIYHAAQLWPQTTGIKLFDEGELVPICSSRLVAPGETGASAIAGLTHLHMSSRPDAWRHWYQAQGQEYLPSISAGPRYELFTMSLAAAREGMGVALVPRFLAEDDLLEGRLVLACDGTLHVKEAYFFSHPQAGDRSEALLAFESWLSAITQN